MIRESAELVRLLGGRLPDGPALAAIRARRLRELVRHAYDNVPLCRRRFDAAGLRPEDVRDERDLRHVPVTTRAELQAAGDDALARGFDRTKLLRARTSGSSGRPLAVYRTRHEDRLRRALDLRSMRHAGVRPRDVVAVLGPVHTLPHGFHERCGLYRTHRISTLLAPDEQIRRLRDVSPSVLWFYPSALRVLVELAGGLEEIVRPRLLIHAAEPFDAPTRHRILGGRELETRNFYGSVETGRIGWECAARDGLHLNADCLIFELVDEPLPGGGKSVVVTNLLSRAMPCLRYRLGDLCESVAGPCPCGAPLPRISAPLGRDWEIVRLPSGRLATPFALAAQIRHLDGLEQYRVVQTHLDRLRLELRLTHPVGAAALAELRERLARQLGEPVTIDIELVEAFAPGGAKFSAFVSDLAPRP